MYKYPLKYTSHIETIDHGELSTRRYASNITVMGDLVNHSLPLTRDGAGFLYYYNGSVYKPNGENAVTEMMHRILHKHDDGQDFKITFRDHVLKYLSGVVPTLEERPDLYRINLLNGIYDWRDGLLHPHTPEYRTLVQIPINYDSEATCPVWDKFLTDIFPVGSDLLYEILGWAMIPYTKMQKCIVLVGGGSNGKSTYLNALSKAIGEENVSAVSLHNLTSNQNKFYNAMLVGKLINKFGDLSNKDLQDVANFKSLTGEDSITIEYKHRNAYSYTPFCRLIFACNKMIKSESDESVGFYRRFFNIPFSRQFDVDPRIGLQLEEDLQFPGELSGMLNRVLPMIPKMIERGTFDITPAIASEIDNYQPIPPVVKSWCAANLVEDETGYLPHNAFYTYFSTHCASTEDSRSKMIGYIKNLYPLVQANVVKKIWKGESPIRCFMGIRLANPIAQKEVISLAFQLKTNAYEHDEVCE